MAKLINKANLKVIYNGRDISKDISPFVISFTYTDHEGGKADDLQIQLEDSKGFWKGSWFPSKGAILKASIVSNFSGSEKQLKCGTFAIDEIGAAGPPDTVTLKAVSSLTAKSLKRETKSRAWENISLQAIGNEITGNHGLSFLYKVDQTITYKRIEQREESDLAFLKRLSDDADLNLKIAYEKIIIFEGKKLEDAASVFSITIGESKIGTYRFSSKTVDIYRGSQIQYWDVDEKKEKTHTFTPPDVPDVGQLLKINQRVETLSQAVAKARSMLRRKNKQEVTANFNLMGNTIYLAGLTGTIEGHGNFDGKYIIDEARHSFNRSAGYTTSIKLRKVLSW
ncbi:MAG: hypothetical protein GY729_06975 [Desulfobacteraceae bacterium]|nr:hypothetical protein [Desulfobacteraceae bacterium]